MKRNLFMLLMAAIAFGTNAQCHVFNGRLDDDECHDLALKAADQITTHMQARKAPSRVLPEGKYLTDKQHTWSDGLYIFDMSLGDEGYLSLSGFTTASEMEHFDFIGPLYVKNGKVLVEDKPQVRVNVEQLGDFVMLVERDKAGKPVRAYYRVPEGNRENDSWVMYINNLFMGHYTTADGADVVFGPRMPFYSGKEYNTDPGIFCFKYDYNYAALFISYGGKRVSRGNPDRVKDGISMPGEGGAGALMPPMIWAIQPTVAGLDVVVVHDEPYVDHYPSIGRQNDQVGLTWVESPFKDLPGRWAIASVIPLTHTLLKLLPKEVLTLMRGEIYARHGDTFKDPDTQRYFDTQPWYKKSGKPVQLTDVERFNYQLIKQVEATK